MKNITSHLFLLVLTILLTSCGQSKSPTVLNVTSGFALSAADFKGGLVVTGQSETEKFSMNAMGGDSINLHLTRGKWTFNVVGWSGGSSTDPLVNKAFKGTSYCGSAEQFIDGASTVVDIRVTEDNCKTNEWMGEKQLKVFNCSSSTTDLSESGFCSQGITAQYAQITVPASVVNGKMSPAITTGCLSIDPSKVLTTEYYIPLLKVPVTVHLSNFPDCSKTFSNMFPNGILGAGKASGSIVNQNLSAEYYGLFVLFPVTAKAAAVDIIITEDPILDIIRLETAGVNKGDTVSLYTDDSCTNLVSEATATVNAVVDLGTEEISNSGTYNLYVKITDSKTNLTSECSSSGVEYTR